VVLALTEVDSFQPQQLSQPLDLRLEVTNQTRVRVFVDDRLTDDLLGSVCISTLIHPLT